MNKELEFHRSRKAFAILGNKLEYIPNELAELSHYDWLVKHKGLTDTEFNNIVRGYTDATSIYFYMGDFETNETVERKACEWHSKIDARKRVYCGVVKGNIGEQWKPIKELEI